MKDAYDPTKPFNEHVRKLIADTHSSRGPLIVRPHGKRFSKEIDPVFARDYKFMSATDGIGTKGLLHWLYGTPERAPHDAFAMTADDLMEGGFTPMYFQDHLMLQEENQEAILSVVSTLRDLCRQNAWEHDGVRYPVVITGGETAILNTIQGLELGITMEGFVRRGEEIIPNAREGDVLIGLGSNGLHSNGYTFVREELLGKRGMTLQDKLPWGVKLGEELTRPTIVYASHLQRVVKEFQPVIHGMVHITGGGLSKLRELTPKKDVDLYAWKDTAPQPLIFQYLHDLGCLSEKMYTRFNNGVGYVIAVPQNFSGAVAGMLDTFSPRIIGEARKGTGKVIIESQYNGKTHVY